MSVFFFDYPIIEKTTRVISNKLSCSFLIKIRYEVRFMVHMWLIDENIKSHIIVKQLNTRLCTEYNNDLKININNN